MKYKVGDKVRIKTKEWYDKNKDSDGNVKTRTNCVTVAMSKYCGMEAIVTQCGFGSTGTDCTIDIDNGRWCWPIESFDDLYNIEKPKNTLFDQIKSAIIESAKESPILIEPTEDGGVKISPLKVDDDLPIDTPCVCCNSGGNDEAWFFRYYAGNCQTWWKLGKSCNEKRKVNWNCIIPFDKFNPNDFEESLKHNIVK